MIAQNFHAGIPNPNVISIDFVAARESGYATVTYVGIVILKNVLYQVRASWAPLVILRTAHKITEGKHNGARNQPGPP